MHKSRYRIGRFITVCGSVIALLIVPYVSIHAEIDPKLVSRLQKTLDDCVSKYRIAGATVAVALPDQGTWVGAGGMADRRAGTPMVPENLFRIASISKTFVAATILELAEEDVLNLEDTIEHWLPGLVPNGENITIRHLLTHTSGLFNFTNVWFAEGNKDLDRIWQPEELVAMATAQKTVFAPGSSYAYCNTGYILLGMIIETATNSPVEQEIRRRLLDPLQLSNTFLDVREEVPTGVAQSDAAPDPYTSLASAAWVAGGMVSNAVDLAKWATALYSGQVLEQASLDAMLTFAQPHTTYGFGVMKQGTLIGSAVGHTGGITGYDSMMFYIPDTGIVIVVLVNQDSGANAIFNSIVKVLSNPESISVTGKLASTWGSVKNQT